MLSSFTGGGGGKGGPQGKPKEKEKLNTVGVKKGRGVMGNRLSAPRKGPDTGIRKNRIPVTKNEGKVV